MNDAPAPAYARALRRDMLRYLPSALVPGLAGVLLLPLLTSVFSPASYGNYAVSQVVYSLLDAAAVSWYGNTVVRFRAGRKREDARELEGTLRGLGLVASLVASLLCIVGTLVTRPAIDSELFDLLLLLPLVLIPSALLELPLQVLRSDRRLGPYNALVIAKVVASPFVGLGIGVLLGGSVSGLVWGAALVAWLLVPIAYAVCYLPRRLPGLRLFRTRLAGELLAFGVPLAPSVLMLSVLSISDRMIVGATRGATEAGLYAVGADLASLPLVLIYGLVTRAIGPLIVGAWEHDGRVAAERLQTFATRLYFLVGLPATVGLIGLAYSILDVLAAPDYRAAGSVFPAVAGGTFLFGLQLIAQRGLMLGRNTGAILACYLISGLVNIAANLLLVPTFGYEAAGWTTLASYALLLLLIAWRSSRYLAWRLPVVTMANMILACALMLGSLQLLPDSISGIQVVDLGINVLVGALVYGAVLLARCEIALPRRRAMPAAQADPGKVISG